MSKFLDKRSMMLLLKYWKRIQTMMMAPMALYLSVWLGTLPVIVKIILLK